MSNWTSADIGGYSQKITITRTGVSLYSQPIGTLNFDTLGEALVYMRENLPPNASHGVNGFYEVSMGWFGNPNFPWSEQE